MDLRPDRFVPLAELLATAGRMRVAVLRRGGSGLVVVGDQLLATDARPLEVCGNDRPEYRHDLVPLVDVRERSVAVDAGRCRLGVLRRIRVTGSVAHADAPPSVSVSVSVGVYR